MNIVIAASAVLAVVSFKDAAKIKSWDAWDDHKAPVAWTEKRSVTREKIAKMDPGLKDAGALPVRDPAEIRSDVWSVGCECLDRDYAEWDQYKRFLRELGAKHARFLSGWAKTEQEKGVYDFAWLDKPLRECAAAGIRPWVCISYGNPVWGSDFRLGMRVSQIVNDPAALAAWLRYVRALVARYADIVDEWEIWNEPFGQSADYATLVYETAKAVKEVQPGAKCMVTALAWWKGADDHRAVAERLKAAKALDLVKYWVVHPYEVNPDTSYAHSYEPISAFLKAYNPAWEVVQGECGCPSQLEFAHALSEVEWTEYAQAKWDLRRALGDFLRGYKSNLFTITDLQYTFMLQSFGLIRSNALKESVYRRPSYFAMRNVYSIFDADMRPLGIEKRTVNGRELTWGKCEKGGRPVHVFWFSGERPGDSLEYVRADLSFAGNLTGCTWVDLLSGKTGVLDDAKSVPIWDSPVMVSRRREEAK